MHDTNIAFPVFCRCNFSIYIGKWRLFIIIIIIITGYFESYWKSWVWEPPLERQLLLDVRNHPHAEILTLPCPFMRTMLEMMDGWVSLHGDSTWAALKERVDFFTIW